MSRLREWYSAAIGLISIVAFGTASIVTATVEGAMAQATTPQSRPIERPIMMRDGAAVQYFLDAGSDPNERLSFGKTPSILAAAGSAWDIVLVLLRNGADPALTDRRGLSVATFARTSRVHPDSKEGRALEEVRAILTERGLY